MERTTIVQASLIAFAASIGPCAGALAQPENEPPPVVASEAASDELDFGSSEDDPWRFEFTAWAWLLGVDGDVGARGTVVNTSVSFVDVLDASDSVFALSGRLEGGYGPFGAFVDGLYADIELEDQSGPVGLANVDVEFQQEILDFGLMYRVIDQPTPRGGAAQGRNWTVDVFGGGRYVGIDLELRPEMAEARSRDRDWLDPIVGVKTVVPLGERWRFIVSGDVGGFGAESDFTGSATAVLGYDFRLFGADASALAGYRAITWDYSDGSGDEEFTWDVVQHGILLGLELRW